MIEEMQKAASRLCDSMNCVDKRLHISHQKDLRFYRADRHGVADKPNGLWYSFGLAWLSWVLRNKPSWVTPYIYEVHIYEEHVLNLEFESRNLFEDNYAYKAHQHGWPTDATKVIHYIDWPKVALEYRGVEVPNYSRACGTSSWLRAWDVPSGCVWSRKAIERITLFAYYDKGKFVRI